MNHFSVKKSLQHITDGQKQELTLHIFPGITDQEFTAAWPDVVLCFTSTDRAYRLNFARLLKGIQWLRQHNYRVPQNIPVETATN